MFVVVGIAVVVLEVSSASNCAGSGSTAGWTPNTRLDLFFAIFSFFSIYSPSAFINGRAGGVATGFGGAVDHILHF